ncbi:glycosyltransferase family 2 protein [Roseibium album]|uniref:glycosyltransferase family 2 protein n=1 Tax=Roseibium album TaxID=311410 RepID=UPI0024909D7C|nr:glycosyltransferase family 2 protein [Roseibium album]
MMNLNVLAPVALFAFNRPEHTRRTLEAIANNDLASATDLFVFVDGPRNEDDVVLIREVCTIARGMDAFKSLTIVEQDANIGLAKSIVQGIDKVLEEYSNIIVLEDDIVTSPVFLNYMNASLARYESEKKVWHICGYNEPTENRNARQSYFSRLMNCWGWGTWRDRWEHFERKPEKLVTEFTPEMIDRFNLDIGEKFWFQVLANVDGRMNTWAIFWYATIFKQSGLCLNPHVSYVRNIGFDGSGVHCNVDEFRNKKRKLNLEPNIEYPEILAEDHAAFEYLKKFYTLKKKKPGKVEKIKRKILRKVISL